MYTAEISRRAPACFLFVIDQSGSMLEVIGGLMGIRKADFVADALNKTLQNLVISCAKSEGMRDYFNIGVIGYGGHGVGSAFVGFLQGREIVPISDIAENPARVDDRIQRMPDGAGGIYESPIKFPIWFDATASGGTPMVEALNLVEKWLVTWVNEHQSSYPPIVMHITDGESSDGDPTDVVNRIRELATEDGNVLIFNLHTSHRESPPTTFPSDETQLPDDAFAQLLFRLSSIFPENMSQVARSQGYSVESGTKGFIFNASITEIVAFFNIGTQPSNLR